MSFNLRVPVCGPHYGPDEEFGRTWALEPAGSRDAPVTEVPHGPCSRRARLRAVRPLRCTAHHGTQPAGLIGLHGRKPYSPLVMRLKAHRMDRLSKLVLRNGRDQAEYSMGIMVIVSAEQGGRRIGTLALANVEQIREQFGRMFASRRGQPGGTAGERVSELNFRVLGGASVARRAERRGRRGERGGPGHGFRAYSAKHLDTLVSAGLPPGGTAGGPGGSHRTAVPDELVRGREPHRLGRGPG